MNDYPPITAAIRSRVESGWDPWPEAREWLLGKCDTIDAIHARLEAAYDRLRTEGEHDYAPESHYVMLPKDADGVPWHIGDVTENGGVVHAMRLDKNGWIFLGQNDIDPSIHHHHTPDTWERIIEDAIRGDGGSYGCLEERFNATVPALVARCKALAGDAE